MTMDTLSVTRAHGGTQHVVKHASRATGTDMTFSVFVPPQADDGSLCPVVWYLSGLTCTHANVTEKGEYRRACAELGLIFVAPDTSPRGEGVPDDPAAAYDFGLGAGFYVDATQAPFDRHYRMYSYVVDELPEVVASVFPLDLGRQAITGHSMGGHGALTIALRNPGRYRSVSAFAPIVAPSHVPWGETAFAAYLGDDRAAWKQYDACELIASARERLPLLVDQGEADEFLATQLQPERLRAACAAAGHPLTLRMQPGHDHSYYFVASFIGEHIAHHAAALKRPA